MSPSLRDEKKWRNIAELIVSDEFTRARELLQIAIGEDPENPKAFNLLGVMYEKQGNMITATRMYRVALVLEPSYTPAEMNLDRLVQLPRKLSGIALGVENFNSK